jgi:hypothetical protein
VTGATEAGAIRADALSRFLDRFRVQAIERATVVTDRVRGEDTELA